MAEDMSEQSTAVGLSIDDITPNVYEGGFKTWECSIDLANYVLALLHKGKCSAEGEFHFVEVRTPFLGARSNVNILASNVDYLWRPSTNPIFYISLCIIISI